MTSPISYPITLLLIASQAITRAGLRLLIDSNPTTTVVGEAGSPLEAADLATRLQPNIILIELGRNGENHIDRLPSLLESANGSRLLLLADRQDQELVHLALTLGVTGVVLKDNSPELLLKAIEKVYLGEAWIDRSTVASVLTELSRTNGKKHPSPAVGDIETLTDREREVITLVALGLRNKQIAERLFISDITVRHHLTSAFGKLGVGDRFELMIYAYRHGLADLPVRHVE